MTAAYIGLGSNLPGALCSPSAQITSAIVALTKIPLTHTVTVSAFYSSKPQGPKDQDDYINAVAKLETGLPAIGLLDALQSIEHEHGRVRERHWGPRTLDLDIVLYGDECIQSERLTVPHVEMLNRAFVLAPLLEIEPDCVIPGSGLARHYLDNLAQTDLEILK